MKKLNEYLKPLSFLLLLAIFILQGFWLYRTFQLTKEKLKEELTKNFITTIKKEVDLEYIECTKNAPDGEFIFDDTGINISSFPINIMILESIHYHEGSIDVNKIKEQTKNYNFQGNIVINKINPQNNKVLESSAPKTKNLWDSALKTEPIPLRLDRSEFLQLYLLNPNWTIFYQMFSVILLSILVVLLVALGLWWQYQNYLKERQIREFQKEHTSAVVHNMVTPLQTIGVVNNTLQTLNNTDKEKQVKFLKAQERQIQNLQSQVEEILTVARAENSGVDINPTQVNIRKLVENLSIPIGKKEVKLHTEFTLDQDFATLDAKLFTDVLNNLIDNAVKYSGECVNITITSTLTAEFLRIVVRDDGFGIATKDQKHIFKKFNRGNAKVHKDIKGFGIGLSFAKAVVEAHKGKITLHSDGKGKGTSFFIEIPQS